MPRIARIVVPDVPYHVTQRGNRHEDVFFSDGDRRVYLDFLDKYAAQHRLDIIAYCLMTNHVHLVATPRTEKSLSNALKPVHLRYTQHVNWTHGLTGRLWQGRFFSCALDDAYLLNAIRCVRDWWHVPRIIPGRVRLHAVAVAGITCWWTSRSWHRRPGTGPHGCAPKRRAR